MAVLLLYTLQLAVNTVKAVSPPNPPPVHVYVSVFMLAGALLRSLAAPRAGPEVARGPERFPHGAPDPRQQPFFANGVFYFFSLLFAKCPRKLRELELPALWMQGSHFPPFR